MTLFLIILIIIFVLLSGYFSAAQTALLSLSQMQVKTYKHNVDPRKVLISKLVSHPRDLLVTLFMLDILVNLIVQNLNSNLFGEGASWGLKVGVPLALTLILGEILPKAFAFAHKTKVAYFVAPTIYFIAKAVRPVRTVLTKITSYISTTLFFFLDKEEEISKEELIHVLHTSKEHGILSHEEAEIVSGYLDLQEATVKELMRPRDEVLIYHLNEPLSKLAYLFVEKGCSRIPVCEGGLEGVKGVISARQFFLSRGQIHESQDVLRFVRKPFFVPETTKAKTLLNQFVNRYEFLAIVVDEYGSVSGLITNEDLIERVVGEIVDKRDGEQHYTTSKEGVIIASGKLELLELEELVGVRLHSPNNQVTIGGWLTEQLGDIPKVGQELSAQGIHFKVLSCDPVRVRRVYIRKVGER